ncbi:MAG: cobalamin-dependent protein, partial [Thermotaleaceae bacterium]
MKILLLEHPRNIGTENINDIANAPLSSCLFTGYIAGVLKQEGHQVDIIEGYLEKMTYEEIEKKIQHYQPEIIGIHMVYQWKRDEGLYQLIHRLKQGKAVSYITAYGYYPTFAYEEIFHGCKSLDSIILGEPEVTFLQLVQKLGEGGSHEGVKGIAYPQEGGSIFLEYARPIENLDSLPFPERTPASLSYGEVNIMGSRGCYGGCTFCYINPFVGSQSPWRARSPENILAEIDQIIEKTNMRYFYFTDPNFFGPGKKGQERALKLASLLKSRKIRFGIEARVNDIHEETIEA